MHPVLETPRDNRHGQRHAFARAQLAPVLFRHLFHLILYQAEQVNDSSGCMWDLLLGSVSFQP